MNTKIVLTISALFLATMGILFSFLPNEIIDYLQVEPNSITILFLKIMSALYLGFAILNWMAKGTLIGGIYNRPLAIGNLMHFGVGAITFVKIISSIEKHSEIIISLAVIYMIFAILFAFIFRINPTKVEKS